MIIGWHSEFEQYSSAILATQFFMNQKPKIIGEASSAMTSVAVGVNDSGQVVGYEMSPRTKDAAHACIWEKQGDAWVWQDLDKGWEWSNAMAINKNGEVTGLYMNVDNKKRAFVWDKYKGMRTIPTPDNHETEG